MKNEKIKYIGLVKWFHDEQRNADYGFIQHAILGDVYFNGKNIIKGQPNEKFSENDVVIFKARASTRKKDGLEAIDIYLIENENEILFLFSHFLSLFSEKGTYSDYNLLQRKVLQAIQKLYQEIIDSERTKLVEIFKDFISELELNYHTAKTIANLTQSLFEDSKEQIIAYLITFLNKEVKYLFWLDGIHNEPDIDYISTIVMKGGIDESKIFARCDSKTKNELFFKLIFDLESKENEPKISALIKILELCEEYIEEEDAKIAKDAALINRFKDFISGFDLNYQTAKTIVNLTQLLFDGSKEQIIAHLITYLDKETKYKFWLEEIHNEPDIDIIADKVMEKDGDEARIFARCDNKTKNELFFKLIFDLNSIESEQEIADAIKIFELCRKYFEEGYPKISEKILDKSPSYVKLYFWLKDFTDYFNYDEFVIYTITLSVEEQKLFFKKVIKLIHEQKINLTLTDLERIISVDLELYQELGKSNEELNDLDFTISIILQVIKDLSNELVTKRETIFEIIANQVKRPKDLLQIKGFFDKCNGRSKVKVTPVLNDKEEEVDRKVEFQKLKEKPRFAVYCDGRKSTSACTNTGLDFWWCENSKCYKPERELHTPENWKEYSLLDILTILEVNFTEKDYEILLNVINKANRFLEHLVCRECDEILRPDKKTNFAFWGVSNFRCKNESCKKHNEKIYISHCLNGRCADIIDSRGCVTCKPVGADDDCGWYVCNFCHACCNSPQLIKRKWVYDNILKKEYKCHVVGHKDLGELSCNKCGTAMNNSEFSEDDFNRTLNWFIENREKSSHIRNSGQRKDGKWWFLFGKDKLSVEKYKEKLTSLLKIGFSIPDYAKEDKTIQLIAEPSSKSPANKINVFSCSNCKHTIDLNGDYKKYQAMKGFHTNLFKDT